MHRPRSTRSISTGARSCGGTKRVTFGTIALRFGIVSFFLPGRLQTHGLASGHGALDSCWHADAWICNNREAPSIIQRVSLDEVDCQLERRVDGLLSFDRRANFLLREMIRYLFCIRPKWGTFILSRRSSG